MGVDCTGDFFRKKAIEKTILRILRPSAFLHSLGQSRRFRDAPKESGCLPITDIRRQRLKHHDVTKVGGHRSHRVITTHSDHPARRRIFSTLAEIAGSWIAGATERDRTCMTQPFPKTVRALYRGYSGCTFYRFTDNDAAVSNIERQRHEICNSGHGSPTQSYQSFRSGGTGSSFSPMLAKTQTGSENQDRLPE